MLQATCGLWHNAALSVFHTSFVFVSFCLLALQSDFRNEMNRTLSELKVEDFLKSDAVQGGKYTMTVRRVSFHKPIILPFSSVQQKQTFKPYITWFYLGGGGLGVLRASGTPHDMTACLFPSPNPVYLLWQSSDRSRGSSSLIPLPQMKTWSSWHSARAQPRYMSLTFLTDVSTLTVLSTHLDHKTGVHTQRTQTVFTPNLFFLQCCFFTVTAKLLFVCQIKLLLIVFHNINVTENFKMLFLLLKSTFFCLCDYTELKADTDLLSNAQIKSIQMFNTVN